MAAIYSNGGNRWNILGLLKEMRYLVYIRYHPVSGNLASINTVRLVRQTSVLLDRLPIPPIWESNQKLVPDGRVSTQRIQHGDEQAVWSVNNKHDGEFVCAIAAMPW
jgi:hypothetical protein